MPPLLDSSTRRRSLLRILGAAAGTGALERTVDTLRAARERTVVLEQDDRCVELVPLSGDVPVEEFYDYRYPTNLFESVSGSDGSSYSSAGTTDLQRDATSILFLYDGPEGLSLVVVHGRLDGDDDGGVVTFTLRGMPGDATWVVRDDYYLEDGQQAESNYDRWDGGGEVHELDWAYRGGRTDGGAVRGLGAEFEMLIEPAFNDAADLASDHGFGPIEAWEALSGNRDSPDRYPLRLDRPVTIRTGGCEGGTGGEDMSDGGEGATDDDADDVAETDDETDTDDATDSGGDGESDDGQRSEGERERTKHERKREKHRQKHERKQRKHERKRRKRREKHERKQRKHEQKHQRKQRKHEQKHERKQRKHAERGDD